MVSTRASASTVPATAARSAPMARRRTSDTRTAVTAAARAPGPLLHPLRDPAVMGAGALMMCGVAVRAVLALRRRAGRARGGLLLLRALRGARVRRHGGAGRCRHLRGGRRRVGDAAVMTARAA